MSDAIVIHPIDREQLAACVDRFVAVARDLPGEYWSAQHFLVNLPDKWILSLAAWSRETPVGYAMLSRRPSGAAHLHHFMIVADQRGRGLGSQLLVAAIDRCRQNRCAEMSLKVATSSVDAERFYRRHGFDDVGVDGDYRIMRRRLT